jgi:hypothetical protein
VTVTLGLPANVHPLWVTGGDNAWVAFGWIDAGAIGASIVAAWLVLRGRLRRSLGAIALAGLWLVSPVMSSLLFGGALLTLSAWVAARLVPRAPRLAGAGAIGVAAAALLVVLMATVEETRSVPPGDYHGPVPAGVPAAPPANGRQVAIDEEVSRGEDRKDSAGKAAHANKGESGDIGGEGYLADGFGWDGRFAASTLQGVAPVALTLPDFARHVEVSRELVTRDRPLVPTVFYVTSVGLAPLVGVWLACIALLGRLHADKLRRLARGLRERLAKRPVTPTVPAGAPQTAAPSP